jgi:hypothetical protein
VDSRLTYLTVDEQGVRIHEYDEHEYDERERARIDDHDSGQERSEGDSAVAEFADESGLLEDAEYESVSG